MKFQVTELRFKPELCQGHAMAREAFEVEGALRAEGDLVIDFALSSEGAKAINAVLADELASAIKAVKASHPTTR